MYRNQHGFVFSWAKGYNMYLRLIPILCAQLCVSHISLHSVALPLTPALDIKCWDSHYINEFVVWVKVLWKVGGYYCIYLPYLYLCTTMISLAQPKCKWATSGTCIALHRAVQAVSMFHWAIVLNSSNNQATTRAHMRSQPDDMLSAYVCKQNYTCMCFV